MPIFYDEKNKGWSIDALTNKEQEELVKLGHQVMLTSLGEVLYRTLNAAIVEAEDDDTSKH